MTHSFASSFLYLRRACFDPVPLSGLARAFGCRGLHEVTRNVPVVLRASAVVANAYMIHDGPELARRLATEPVTNKRHRERALRNLPLLGVEAHLGNLGWKLREALALETLAGTEGMLALRVAFAVGGAGALEALLMERGWGAPWTARPDRPVLEEVARHELKNRPPWAPSDPTPGR